MLQGPRPARTGRTAHRRGRQRPRRHRQRSRHHRAADLLARLENLDEDHGDWDAERLAMELDDAGVRRTTKQVNIGGEDLAGYRREVHEAAVPAELLNAR
ncbi:hypothetical protein HEP84_43375 [Streptomyces sp. RLB1-33]|nr:hypothetical protein [Streptomyces sp. RLB1-33]QIY74895.1 hypothetical protein HEP84_43375 [Streptomyces sp. RLB1-33]